MKRANKQSIYVDSVKMRRILRKAMYSMDKADRVIYGVPVIQANAEVIANFVMAYDFPDERGYYIRKMCACFSILKADLEIVAEENVIKSCSRPGARMSADGFKSEIYGLLAKIEESIDKWRNSEAVKRTPEIPA